MQDLFYEKYKNATQSANPFLNWRIKPIYYYTLKSKLV